MPLSTKMELHDTPTSKFAEIKAISPAILLMVTTNTLQMISVKMLFNKWLAFL